MNEKKLGRQTHLIHDAAAHNPSPAIASPIYQSATFRFDSPEAISAAMQAEAHPQFYGRYATPNTKQVEATVAQLEGAEAAIAVASGMAAVSLVLLTFLQHGDHVVAQKTLYPTTGKLIHHKLPAVGVETTLVDQVDTGAFAAAIRPDTRMIYCESPANPTMSITDLEAIAELGRVHRVLTVVDNTFASPYNQLPLSLGIDLVVTQRDEISRRPFGRGRRRGCRQHSARVPYVGDPCDAGSRVAPDGGLAIATRAANLRSAHGAPQ
jgi:cystathionine beta-lyase/cystathionine gamma-synthase